MTGNISNFTKCSILQQKLILRIHFLFIGLSINLIYWISKLTTKSEFWDRCIPLRKLYQTGTFVGFFSYFNHGYKHKIGTSGSRWIYKMLDIWKPENYYTNEMPEMRAFHLKCTFRVASWVEICAIYVFQFEMRGFHSNQLFSFSLIKNYLHFLSPTAVCKQLRTTGWNLERNVTKPWM